LAIGRAPELGKIGLNNAEVEIGRSGKLVTVNERTNVSHIYAIGDVIQDKASGLGLELTPVAILAGKLLARRLYGGGTEVMDYVNVPTTVFTPLEYGSCGMSEEDAEKKFGAENIEVYHSFFKPLEWTVAEKEDNACYVKVVCNLLDRERVIGFHVLGTNAGEITQGYACAIKCGVTKRQLNLTVGIHPTSAEEATMLSITKRSGTDAQKTGC